MQLSDLCVCISLPQPVVQQAPEELMVAKPGPLVVKGYQKEVGSAHSADEVLAGQLPAYLAPDRIAQGNTETVEQRGLQQTSSLGFGQPFQGFCNEIVCYELVAALGGFFGEGNRIILVTQGNGGQLQANGPTFCALLKQGRGLVCRCGAERLPQQLTRFLMREAQLRAADLRELLAAAQPLQRQRWIGPRRQNQVNVDWHVLHQPCHSHMDIDGLDHVIIIQHENQRAREEPRS